MSKATVSRREFLHYSALAAVGLIAAACAPSPSAAPTSVPTKTGEKATEIPPTAAPASKEPVKIMWWGEDIGGEQKDVFAKEFVDGFNAAHPDVRLDYVYQQDLNRVLRTAIQAGTDLDLLTTPGAGFVLEYITAGHILDISTFASQYGWKDRLLGWAYESGMVEGKLYSLPLTCESMIVFQNKSLFDQKGWKVPTSREETEALAEAAKAEGIYPFAAGNQDWKAATEWFMGMFWDHYAGADNVYKALIGEKKWTDEELVGAMKLMNDWFQKGYFSGSIDNYHAFAGNDYISALATGKAATMMDGTWAIDGTATAFKESGQEWDWFPMPSLRPGVKPVYALATGATVSLNAKSKHPAEAAQVLDWLYQDKERALKISAAANFGNWVLPLEFTAADFPAETDKRIVRYYEEFARVTGQGDYGYTTWTFWPAKTEVYLSQGFDEVLAGVLTVEQFSAEVQKMFDEERKAGKVPPVPKRAV